MNFILEEFSRRLHFSSSPLYLFIFVRILNALFKLQVAICYSCYAATTTYTTSIDMTKHTIPTSPHDYNLSPI